jgi:hypothetical protein
MSADPKPGPFTPGRIEEKKVPSNTIATQPGYNANRIRYELCCDCQQRQRSATRFYGRLHCIESTNYQPGFVDYIPACNV